MAKTETDTRLIRRDFHHADGRRRSTLSGSRVSARRNGIRQTTLLHRIAGIDPHRVIAVRRERRDDLLGMGAVARLDRHVEPRALGRHIEKQPLVIDFEDIGAELAQPASRSGPARPAGREW